MTDSASSFPPLWCYLLIIHPEDATNHGGNTKSSLPKSRFDLVRDHGEQPQGETRAHKVLKAEPKNRTGARGCLIRWRRSKLIFTTWRIEVWLKQAPAWEPRFIVAAKVIKPGRNGRHRKDEAEIVEIEDDARLDRSSDLRERPVGFRALPLPLAKEDYGYLGGVSILVALIGAS
ncbi:hypothetical protein Hypma_006172 [Hypsizygus marmoreus]|uniref:Uncharacterized protein n=1 Tax=Hypsizygus marmoreus TaxID=39966 RepID=A0A369JT79_HYPMA|nr:hypothetical protein Hypma_006172 [Hypsizygus marmoreus]